MADSRPHMLFSITKSVVGLTARVLIDTGMIDAERPVAHYLPDLTETAFGDATLTELLAMRDGVAFDETYADPDAAIHHYSRSYWGDALGGARARLAALPRRPRGNAFAYRTPVADVVGAMLSAAAGQDLSDLVGEMLWRPMGAAHPAHFVLDTAGVAIAGAGLNAATDDLARLALLLLEGGKRDGRQVLPERVVTQLFDGGDRQAFARGYPDRPGWSYRDLWWHMGGRRIAALGVHGQRLVIDADHGFALIRTGAQPEPDNRPFDAAHAAQLYRIEEVRVV
ncbi:serine hydrolase [Sphingomonas sp.]|uniref:serine hydrolase domain-containing protein n=1 Tax=Sphingomonas sp. TaxID=28214 RepID=UPI0034285B82